MRQAKHPIGRARAARLHVGTPTQTYPLLHDPPLVEAVPFPHIEVHAETPGEFTMVLPLEPGEAIWGCGQRLDAFNLRGRRIEHWVTDSWNQLDASYTAVPFFISARGYGLFVNHPGRVTLDIGASDPNQLIITVQDDAGELIVFTGTPSAISQTYTSIVGRPRTAPTWVFRPWLSRNSYLGADEINRTLDRMTELGMPVGAVVLEAWAEHLHSFTFERRRFPQASDWIYALARRGVSVVCWITSSVRTDSRAYREAKELGYLVLNEDGSEHVVRWLEGGREIDFRTPHARRWWRDLHAPLIAQGINGIKTDGGEHMPDPSFHNQHPFHYQRASLDAFLHAGRDGITLARSANPRSASLGALWAGDQHAEWSGLAAVVRGGLSAALSGFPLWGHDVGGYSGTPTKRLYLRWLQFGAFSPIMLLHGQTAREPWHYDAQTVSIARFYFRVRERLQPLLQLLGRQALADGTPIIRPLVWHTPDDRATHTIDSQFLLGPDLLIAPLVEDRDERSVYLPRGRWTDLWTGATHQGPTTITVTAALHQIPAFANATAAAAFRHLFSGAPTPDVAPIELALTGTPNERGIIPRLRHLSPGKTTDLVEYLVQNRSTRAHVVEAHVSAPGDLVAAPLDTLRFALQPGQSRHVRFKAHIEPTTQPGTYPLRLRITDHECSRLQDTVQIVLHPTWVALGPFPGGVGSPPELDAHAIDPDATHIGLHGAPLRWQRVPERLLRHDGGLDLGEVLGNHPFTSSYVRTNLHSNRARTIRCKVGCGDALTIWLNGRTIHDNPTHRNPEADQDTIGTYLDAGSNHILIRLHRDLAPHRLYFRIE